ncbi:MULTISPECIES: hypothetical protein [Tenacibaculum]|nr:MULTISPECIES: hypothetical protein [Tenacibaculum]GFD76931.1 hypothetical protein KUL113_63510 [Tenacibaculum sp. KUL113]GFD78173.1 hypothetical protein KUL118_10350 [Tenacibaculum sp. KUL118]MCG7500784.1 hypothetical protein [Tenacibaculum sp. Mcav3-52]MCO7184171.1 hypothetical protein [Tenacibaculum sp. XPcli2-G]SHF69332.1 hypothetical protein SAMN05444344_1227 [Tenacibaculum mesophilum]
MKKILILFLSVFTFYSCLDDDSPNVRYEFLKVDSATTPESFTFGEVDTIKIKYTLPNSCYSFNGLYYQKVDTTRIVAGTAIVALDVACTQDVRQEEYAFPVEATQEEDYVFKFWKGKNDEGEDVYEEVVIPVNL